ncbi:acyl-CoA thioesterase [Myxococcus sp. K15C18031901]|uniref:acyl-CoA thioesterase n=1 Tax=Myxococcus dinghuensis TaxID=2906761 RepID=UPI0020A779B0|nr:acyl-CoA thioesterase [Myxococcus dinghuensis]MCP3102400.1 acyl-CoA thioesterase [Myxococcus dinghuensis]
MKPDLSHEIELAPAFHDLDPMEVVWHGHYVKYLELARCALLARFDYDYPQMRESGYAWPVVDLRLKYVQPAVYAQRLRIRAEITEWENRLRIDYLIRDAATGRKVNQAHTLQVAVSLATREMQFVCPPVLWERLGVRPE